MKKKLSLLLAICILFSLCACGTAAPEVTASSSAPTECVVNRSFSDTELSRADQLGFIPADWTEDTLSQKITSAEYCKILSRAVELYDPNCLPIWEKEAEFALTSTDEVYHVNQIVATYFAACSMGIGATVNGKWIRIAEHFPGWDLNYLNNPFPQVNTPSPLQDLPHISRCPQWPHHVSGQFWIMGQFSRTNAKNIMDFFDTEYDLSTTIPNRAITREEGIRAGLRLYESTFSPIVKKAEESQAAALYTAADERRESILSAATTISHSDTWEQGKTYSGTAYYVSNNGSDSNNGTSENTPWKTLDKVNKARLKKGDAVFFCRGDLWYGQLWGKAGVTYSAYGEGAKPAFSGSIPAIANEDAWSLHYEDNSGQKIWIYQDQLADVSGILMNNNTQWAEKYIPGWNGETYVTMENQPVVLEEAFAQDLMFFSALDLSGHPSDVRIEDDPYSGPLYLRCDKGNPGTVFSDIQFIYGFCGFSPEGEFGSGCTVDNLGFYYYAGPGVSCAGYQGWTGTRIQNCEIAWCGGGLQEYYHSHNFGFGKASFSGGAVHCAGNDNTIHNNYIHDCDSKVFIMTIHDRGPNIPTTYENTHVTGNLVERSGAALHLMSCMFMYDTDRLGIYKDFLYEDNFIMDTGFGWIQQKLRQGDNYLEGGQLCSIGLIGLNDGILENVRIQNNVFCGSVYTLVGIQTQPDNFPIFTRNTYAQYEYGWTGDINGRMMSITENAAEQITQLLGDSDATTIVIK